MSIAEGASELTAEVTEVSAEIAEESFFSAFPLRTPRRPLRL